ncbi:MAG: hypothetical protein HC819_00325 [Cyclobacteriaceae bacterium]|nr:hypothetical protein [Cyclobacteriaceae bacterium]
MAGKKQIYSHLGECKTYNKERPGKEREHPDVLTRDEISKMIHALNNLKHKCMLRMIYSGGLKEVKG